MRACRPRSRAPIRSATSCTPPRACRRKSRIAAGDPVAIRKIRASCDAAHLAGILAQSESWLPIVRRKRPDQPWGDVVRVLNRGHESNCTVKGSAAPSGGLSPRAWSRRSCWTARRGNWCGWQPASPRPRRTAHCNRLLLRSRPRGGTRWHPSSVKHLLVRADRLGLAGTPPSKVSPARARASRGALCRW
jgi:hypothetical protein